LEISFYEKFQVPHFLKVKKNFFLGREDHRSNYAERQERRVHTIKKGGHALLYLKLMILKLHLILGAYENA